jgi:hypothetical protein
MALKPAVRRIEEQHLDLKIQFEIVRLKDGGCRTAGGLCQVYESESAQHTRTSFSFKQEEVQVCFFIHFKILKFSLLASIF